jgi:hypothetical protein
MSCFANKQNSFASFQENTDQSFVKARKEKKMHASGDIFSVSQQEKCQLQLSRVAD